MLFTFNVTDILLTAGTDSSIEALERERIPRIICQTWKTNVLPDIGSSVKDMPQFDA